MRTKDSATRYGDRGRLRAQEAIGEKRQGWTGLGKVEIRKQQSTGTLPSIDSGRARREQGPRRHNVRLRFFPLAFWGLV
jgi:hypothetical protein